MVNEVGKTGFFALAGVFSGVKIETHIKKHSLTIQSYNKKKHR
jgi:hypothetical protein